MFKYTKHLKYIAIIGFMVSPFVTKPPWCIDKWEPDDPNYEDCGFYRNFLNDENYNVDDDWKLVGYPKSYFPSLKPKT